MRSARRLPAWFVPTLLLGAVLLPSSAHARRVVAADPVPGRLVLRGRAGLTVDALHSVLRRSGLRRLHTVPGVGATIIEGDRAELAAVAATLRRSGLFRSVERDHLVTIAEEPDDPHYPAQWGLPRTGVPAAWGLSTGGGTVVGVLDTGVDASHPDLQGQVLPGWDFVNADADPNDDHGHGTRMSGIIAARRGNGEGVAGIAPDALVLPVKVLDADGYGSYSAVAAGIVYAVDQGARIVNLSLSGPVHSDLLQDAVDYATAHDAVVVAAAGNYGDDGPVYPAASSGAVAVGAVDDRDARPAFSSYGPWLSLAAPGVDIVTTSLFGSYAGSTGTSPAAAFASGVLALFFGAHPDLTRADAIARVTGGALDLGSRGWDQYFGAGLVDAYATLVPGAVGAPPIDTRRPEVTIISPAKRSLLWGAVPVDVAANDDVDIARVELFIDNRWYATAFAPPYQFVVDAAQFAPGTHKLRADAYDSAGNYGRSRTTKVTFTPGVGVLVRHAVAKPTRIGISADFALPEGTMFDPARDSLVITLTDASGTVFSAVAQAGALGRSAGSGKAQGTITPVVPASGRVRLVAKSAGQPTLYRLKLKASDLNGMGLTDGPMNFAVEIGGTQLSQSLTFRAKRSTLLYP